MRELERRFSPEFRNRIDEVVLFSPLTHDEVRRDRAALPRAGSTTTLRERSKTLIVDAEALERSSRRATAWPSARGS